MRLLIAAALALTLVGGPTPVADADDRAAAEPGTWSPDSVTRLSGDDRIATAIAASAHAWDRAGTVVLASGAAFPDALAGAALAAERDAPLLLTWPDRLPSALAAELERLDPDEVVVLGGDAAIDPATARAAADAAGASLRRVAGPDRWATAAAVAEQRGPSGGEVVLASGTDFADALAAGGLDGGDGPSPVLLTTRDALPDATEQALADLDPARVTVVGGERAVSEAVAEAARAHADDVARLAGATRYATSVAVLAEARARADAGGGDDDGGSLLAAGELPVLVASGTGFADALAAGGLAGRLGGQVALSTPARLPDRLDAWLRGHDAAADRLLGGRVALAAHVRTELAAIVDRAPRPWHTRTSAGGFRGVAGPLPAATREAMTGVSWEPGCPVALDDLALLEMPHATFDGDTADGVMVAHRAVAVDLLGVFAAAHDAGFPLERMRLVADYDGDDDASMADNNTSAFNCRAVTGGEGWSQHAHGTAVDLNPVQNPYHRDGEVKPPAGEPYLDRADRRPGMIARPGPVVDAFDALGWEWGGDWRSLKDWMHFEARGSR